MSRKNIKVTSHARRRAKERLNVSYHSEVNKTFNDALKYGHPQAEYRGSFADWLEIRKKKSRPGTGLKVHRDILFIYRNKTIITTYKVPKTYIPTDNYLASNYRDEPVYMKKVRELVGDDIDYKVFDPSSDGDLYVACLFVSGIFEGYGSGKTKAKALNSIAKAYISRVSEDVEDDRLRDVTNQV